jgi:hypothetical protein
MSACWTIEQEGLFYMAPRIWVESQRETAAMTTTAQVRKLVQPILARKPDLALVDRWIFIKPVHRFARTILIGRSSSVDEIVPQWAVMHLFEVRSSFFLG